MKEALKDSLAILPGYLVLGIGFGVLMLKNGFNSLQVFLMSAFIYAGSLQYVGVELLTRGASLLTAALMSLMVNIRHLFYGISMLKDYSKIQKGKIYDIFALTDETFSIVCHKDTTGLDKDRYYFFLSLLDQCYWVAGSLIGAFLSDIPFIDFTGIEFSMTALFIVIVIDQWQHKDKHRIVIMTFILTGMCLVLFGSDDFLLPAMLGIVAMLAVLKKAGGSDA